MTRPSSPRVAMPGGTEVSILLKRLYLPSGDFAEPAYAARTSHWATSLKRGAGLRVAPSALGIAGTTLIGPAASSGPFAGAVRGRQRVQAQQFRYRRRPRTPGAPQAKDQRADRGQRMAVDGPQVDRRLVPQPGQNTSSHGVPATSAARMVGDHRISRPVAKRRFQRSTTSSASVRAARSAFSLAAPALMSSPRVRTPIAPVLTIRQT